MRISVLATAISSALIGLAMADPAAATAIKTQINIAPQELSNALRLLAADRNLQILYTTETVADRHTAGAVGEFTVVEALTRLLGGTGLAFHYVDDTTITIVPLSTLPSKGRDSRSTSGTSEAGTAGSALGGETKGKGFWNRLRIAQAESSSSSATARTTSAEQLNQQDTVELEEVIVTAQKRAERLQDVPVPVTVLKTERLAASNQLRLQDYYTKLPGLSLAIAGNESESIIAVRGLKTGAVSNPTVGIVVDEVPYGVSVTTGFAPTVPDIDPGDLSQIELLRGPQGTLYGASSIGGLLKFVTVDPSTEGVSGRVQVGSVTVDGDAGYSARGAVNVPLTRTLALRASGFTVRDPGYVDNIQAGERNVNERDADGGLFSALWRPSESFSLKLSALLQDVDRLGSPEVNTSLGSGEFLQRMPHGTGINSRESQVYNATMTALFGNGIEFTSATGYSSDEAFSVIDQTPGFGGSANQIFGVTGAILPATFEANKFSQEIRLDIPLGERVNWLFGGFYMDEDARATTNIQAADATTGAVAGSLLLTDVDSSYKEYAFFTNATVDVTDRLDVQVGGRWSENESAFQNRRRGPLSVTFFGSDPFVSPKFESEDNPVTYLLTPRFKFTPDMMAYLRLASGYRPGGPNAACGIVNTPCQYDADTTQTYEFGFKGEVLDRALTFDASLYYIDWKDVQIRVLHPTVAGVGYTVNQASAKSQGVELSMQTEPLSGLSVSGWVAYNEAELTEAFPSTSTTFGRAGDPLPYNGRWSGNLAVDQKFPLWGLADASIGASVSYIGDRKGEFTSSSTARRDEFPSYMQLDLYALVRYEAWTANLFVNNVTDKRAVLKGTVNGINPLHIYIQPRTVGLSLSRAF